MILATVVVGGCSKASKQGPSQEQVRALAAAPQERTVVVRQEERRVREAAAEPEPAAVPAAEAPVPETIPAADLEAVPEIVQRIKASDRPDARKPQAITQDIETVNEANRVYQGRESLDYSPDINLSPQVKAERDAARQIARRINREVVFVSPTVTDFDGAATPLSRDKTVIFLNAKREKSVPYVLGHEWYHTVKKAFPDIANEFENYIMTKVKPKGLENLNKIVRIHAQGRLTRTDVEERDCNERDLTRAALEFGPPFDLYAKLPQMISLENDEDIRQKVQSEFGSLYSYLEKPS